MFRVESCLLEDYVSDSDCLCRVNLRTLRNSTRTVSDSKGHNYTFVVCGNLTSDCGGSGDVGECVYRAVARGTVLQTGQCYFIINNKITEFKRHFLAVYLQCSVHCWFTFSAVYIVGLRPEPGYTRCEPARYTCLTTKRLNKTDIYISKGDCPFFTLL